MNDEEKRAIEYLRKYIHFETYGERSLDTDINTVLNLIEKQEKEIKKLKKQAELSAKARIELTESQDATIEKQEKVIDEMALHIASSAIVDDTVCMYIDCNNEECHSDTAVECTKQYFYRKVENNE